MSSSSLDKIVFKEFNKAAKGLIKDLLVHFPDEEYFKLISCTFAIVKRLSKKKPQQVFHELVEEPFGKEVLDRDIAFFTSERFHSNYWPAFGDFIRKKLLELDQPNKQAVFDHLLVMIACSKKCQAYRAQKSKGRLSHDEASSGGEESDTS